MSRENLVNDGTRRAPHMERYVEVTQFTKSEPWRVRLKVGVQSFPIGDGYEAKETAEWTRDMLCIALDAMVTERLLEEVSRVNARLANETPLTDEQAEELTKRAT